MSLNELFLKKFDALIAYGKELPTEIKSSDDRAKLYSWETSCLNLLEKTFGKDSDYYKRLVRYSKYTVVDLRAPYGVDVEEG